MRKGIDKRTAQKPKAGDMNENPKIDEVFANMDVTKKPPGGALPEHLSVGSKKYWILRSAHAWGSAYVEAATTVFRKKPFDKDKYYEKGVQQFLDENIRDVAKWIAIAFPRVVPGGPVMNYAMQRSTLINIHLTYQRALRQHTKAREERATPVPVPPSKQEQNPPFVIEDPDAEPKKQQIPANRRKPIPFPRPPAETTPRPAPVPVTPTPPFPAVQKPPALDKATADARKAFYANPMQAERMNPFYAPPTISHEDIADTIRNDNKFAVYRAPGMGHKPYLIPPESSSAEDQTKWRMWERSWTNPSESVAWQRFFRALQDSNKEVGGGSIIDSDSRLVKVGVSKQNRGPLKLRYLSNGVYNVVYSADSADASLIPPGINPRRVVFRVPIVEESDTGDNALTVVTAARELANCLNAAEAGIGPPVLLGAAILRVERNPSRGINDNQVVSACDLYTCSERLDTTLENLFHTQRLEQLRWTDYIPSVHVPYITAIFSRTADLVFAYSVRRFIHLDASLANFMVQSDFTNVYGDSTDQYAHKLKSITNVFAIDLDPKLFRLVGQGKGGYVCLWLYNILFLSAQLKANTPPAIFALWMKQPIGTTTLWNLIDHVRHEVKLRLEMAVASSSSDLPTATDPDCHWVTQTRWRGPIVPWNPRTVDLVHDPEIEYLMIEMKQLVYHYFVNIPNRTIRQAATEGRIVPKQAVETMNFFSTRLFNESTPAEQAPLMVDVLVDFLVQ